MENVKFVKYDRRDGMLRYFFKINGPLADYVRKNTCYTPEMLPFYLTEGNLFVYNITPGGDFTKLHDSFVETVERISNSGDATFFYNHLITNDGYHRSPREIHELMHKEYGLVDIDEDKAERSECDLEWWTAHFFISFARLLFGDPDDYEDESASDGDGVVHTMASRSEITAFLDVLKSIDKIVVVDDVRKYSAEDIKRLYKELDSNDEDPEENA